VTCPSLLRCRPAAAEFFGDLARGSLTRVRDVSTALSAPLRRESTFAQFTRFVLVGGASTAVYALLFVTLKGSGSLPAHVVATVVSSVLANEMHRRLTFRADERVSWLAAQVEAGSVSLFGLVATSVALGWLDASAGSAHPVLQITLVTTITGIIGLIRFVALRWIFRPTEAVPAR
jgi:putative flippase GtrA